MSCLARLQIFGHLRCLVFVYPILGLLITSAAALGKPNNIDISYSPPKDPSHEKLATLLQERRVLEQLQQVLMPIRLPRKLTLTLAGCDGESNAFYDNDKVQVCYEMVDEIVRKAPKERTASGVEPSDAVVGSLLFLSLHEISHALFDMLDVPIFGGEEIAADQLAAYLMLKLEKDRARRLITGAAYEISGSLEAETKINLKEFSEEHGFPAQRFFNLMCITYGSDPKLFQDLVEKGYLPKERAEHCDLEYEQAAYAFKKLIAPHISRTSQAQARAKEWVRDLVKRPITRKARLRQN